MFVVAIDACPIYACTLAEFTPRASHRHAAVCRRSWIRWLSATTGQASVRLRADACSLSRTARPPLPALKTGRGLCMLPARGEYPLCLLPHQALHRA